ncbi:uncharacterized protein AB675_10068 [Cyphellophora attinorum]|uniref:Xylanolytic transcriptional activator regulatory domain-containing protein n=1 Tax=Cyphellophora attinorum TaxID=1664694 RepID=A0A0N1NYX7_9EURO|nr:uncharacterized protein AB675_10068 [Phialophora attinorum]KPI36740.1 hypothetical protein AB675_10068 [Phialophora attinorum]
MRIAMRKRLVLDATLKKDQIRAPLSRDDGADASTAIDTDTTIASTPGFPRRFLLNQSGRQRYADGGVWASIERRQTVPYAAGTSSATVLSPSSEYPQPLSNPTASADLKLLHPPTERIFPLWQVYLENVDPIIKILHVPTTQKQLLQASQSLNGLPPSFEALMFAIYYAAVSSMQDTVHEPAERSELLDKHGSGVEQALAKASFMTEPDLFALQALTIYLHCARATGHRPPAQVWALTGLLLRLARKLGLHQNPSTLGFSPFESQIRSRLWWFIFVLETMSAEDNDMAISINNYQHRVDRPKCVNDTSLEVSMSAVVEGSSRRSEMVFTERLLDISQTTSRQLFATELGMTDQSPQDVDDDIRSMSSLWELLDQSLDWKTAIGRFVQQYTNVEERRMRIINRLANGDVHYPSSLDFDKEPDVAAVDILNDIDDAGFPERAKKFAWFLRNPAEMVAVAALLDSILTKRDEYSRKFAQDSQHLIDQCFARANRDGRLRSGDPRWRLLEHQYVSMQRFLAEADDIAQI